MSGVAVSSPVLARNSMGEFIAACERGAEKTVKDAIEEGAALSRTFAPIGHKHDKRTVPLQQAIHTRMLGRTRGEWYARARHALAQEKGAAPHPIYGSPGLNFYWEAAGRRFVPASEYYHQPGLQTVVNHPGNPAHEYLRPAYEAVMRRVMAIAKRNYPG